MESYYNNMNNNYAGFGFMPNSIMDTRNQGMMPNMMNMGMNNMDMMQNMLKPIQSFYPQIYHMMMDMVVKLVDSFMRMNMGMMNQSIQMSTIDSMVKDLGQKIMENEEEVTRVLEIDLNIQVVRDDSEERQFGFGGHHGGGGTWFNPFFKVLLINELFRRGCKYCY